MSPYVPQFTLCTRERELVTGPWNLANRLNRLLHYGAIAMALQIKLNLSGVRPVARNTSQKKIYFFSIESGNMAVRE